MQTDLRLTHSILSLASLSLLGACSINMHVGTGPSEPSQQSQTAQQTQTKQQNNSGNTQFGEQFGGQFGGKVYDDTQTPLDGVLVRAKSLNSELPYESQTFTTGGSYAFSQAPSGAKIEIISSREGYATRRRIETLEIFDIENSNPQQFDFGIQSAFGVSYNALSDKPEVTYVTPGRNVAGVDPTTSFVLKFSEPVDKETVENNFIIRAFTSETLSVDSQQTFAGSASVNNLSGAPIFDKTAFNATWNSDDSELVMTFKEQRSLPTDKDSDNAPDYQVTLNGLDGQIKDKPGITRSDNYFKLTDGNFEQSYKFSINTDEIAPTLSSLSKATARTFNLRYSEPMQIKTLSKTIVGGMDGNTASAPAGENAAANYTITLERNGEIIMQQKAWSESEGQVTFDPADPTHKTLIFSSNTDIFQAGDKVTVTAAPSILDPAGNAIANNGNTLSGTVNITF